ncbi:MAG TPA: MoxR family ATPase [Thermoanaerobaculia bacterium]|jgi:MoxR-like ATPase|nr:MoxR family ATPase [Thermoanaerobaculia bacterium]
MTEPLFDPEKNTPAKPAPAGPGDRRDGGVYVYDDQIILAVRVALATGRPLLVRGPSGCGKSSLARHAARVLRWRYYEKVVTSRTQAQDLLWEVDHLRRLQDAQAGSLRGGYQKYIRPGVFWWAFDNRGAAEQAERSRPDDRAGGALDPNLGDDHERAVVLVDEIDKADPDVPNNLLVPVGSLEFQVEETGEPVKTTRARAPLVVITTNDERELPAAFLRRCVELKLEVPRGDRLLKIAQEHFPEAKEKDLKDVADRIEKAVGTESAEPPSPAELLDTIRAVRDLKDQGLEPAWEDLLRITVWKHGRTAKTPAKTPE